MDNGLKSKDDLFKAAVDFMKRSDVDDATKKKVQEIMDQTQETAVKYSKVEGSSSFVRMSGVREDGDAVIAVKKGEEPKQLYTEEEVSRLTTMAGIIGGNGAMVEQKPKKEWNTGKRIGAMLAAVAVGVASFAAGAAIFKEDNAQAANNTPQTEIIQEAGAELEEQMKEIDSVIGNLENSATTSKEKEEIAKYKKWIKDEIESAEATLVDMKDVQENIEDNDKVKEALDTATEEKTKYGAGSKKASTYDEFVDNCEKVIDTAKDLLDDENASLDELKKSFSDIFDMRYYYTSVSGEALPDIMDQLQDSIQENTKGARSSSQEEQEALQ